MGKLGVVQTSQQAFRARTWGRTRKTEGMGPRKAIKKQDSGTQARAENMPQCPARRTEWRRKIKKTEKDS